MMMNRRLAILLLTAATLAIGVGQSEAHPYMWPVWRARYYNWNHNYAQTSYGVPVAMVVPPTATMQTNWGWGVSSSRLERIDHQFGRNYWGPNPYAGPYRATPLWPSDTTQFGVYNVRGPW
jgi:hypothetical protein